MKSRLEWFQPIVPEKNSWDTSTQSCFFYLAHLLVLPMLFTAVNSPNLAQQHWEANKSKNT